MKFKEGNKAGKGRRKGSRNVKTMEWQEFGAYIISTGLARAVSELHKLRGEAYLRHFEALLNYFKAKSNRLEITEIETPIERLSKEALDQRILALYTKCYGQN